ncbi:myosin heavy chain, clone 203-like isoform X2 [Stegodyphus dumicola]|nr:myosin heavy chain, clone 203-like isoform X2 [Stegodyphus dumicola]
MSRKGQRNQVSDTKAKHEIETDSKGLMSELEKEIYAIKINELETKLTRRKQMCICMEEEETFYNSKYKEKKIVKKESMNLLNKAYQEFFTETVLLENELNGMEYYYEQLLKKKEIFLDARKRVERLTELEHRLEQQLSEAEKYSSEVKLLELKLAKLVREVSKRNECFKNENEYLNKIYLDFVERLQSDMTTTVDNMIAYNFLKSDVLPLPYQALFFSGMLGSFWLKSTLEQCENLLKQQNDIKIEFDCIENQRKCVQGILKEQLFEATLHLQLKELKEPTTEDISKLNFVQNNKMIIQLEAEKNIQKELQSFRKKCLLQERQIEELEQKAEQLEKELNLLGNLNKYDKKNSQLLEIIKEARDVIKKYLEVN